MLQFVLNDGWGDNSFPLASFLSVLHKEALQEPHEQSTSFALKLLNLNVALALSPVNSTFWINCCSLAPPLNTTGLSSETIVCVVFATSGILSKVNDADYNVTSAKVVPNTTFIVFSAGI